MGVLDGKTVLVTGVLTEASIAFRTAAIAQEEGASVVLTGATGRGLTLTQRIARRLPREAPVVELDVTNTEHLYGLAEAFRMLGYGGVEWCVHASFHAPEEVLGCGFLS